MKSFSECIIFLEAFFFTKKKTLIFFYLLDTNDSVYEIQPSEYDTYTEFQITKIPIILIVKVKKKTKHSIQIFSGLTNQWENEMLTLISGFHRIAS